jgi:hypothetical protein
VQQGRVDRHGDTAEQHSMLLWRELHWQIGRVYSQQQFIYGFILIWLVAKRIRMLEQYRKCRSEKLGRFEFESWSKVGQKCIIFDINANST